MCRPEPSRCSCCLPSQISAIRPTATSQGDSYLGGLIQAVIRFISRWTRTKDRVVELDQSGARLYRGLEQLVRLIAQQASAPSALPPT